MKPTTHTAESQPHNIKISRQFPAYDLSYTPPAVNKAVPQLWNVDDYKLHAM